MYLSWRIISLENAAEFPIFCRNISEALLYYFNPNLPFSDFPIYITIVLLSGAKLDKFIKTLNKNKLLG